MSSQISYDVIPNVILDVIQPHLRCHMTLTRGWHDDNPGIRRSNPKTQRSKKKEVKGQTVCGQKGFNCCCCCCGRVFHQLLLLLLVPGACSCCLLRPSASWSQSPSLFYRIGTINGFSSLLRGMDLVTSLFRCVIARAVRLSIRPSVRLSVCPSVSAKIN